MCQSDDLASLGSFFRYGMPTALVEWKTVTIVETKVKQGGRLGRLLQHPSTPALNATQGSDMFLNDNECNWS